MKSFGSNFLDCSELLLMLCALVTKINIKLLVLPLDDYFKQNN